jgi:hypothetical protein
LNRRIEILFEVLDGFNTCPHVFKRQRIGNCISKGIEIVTEGEASHLQVLKKEKTGSMDRSGPADHSG